MKIPTGITFLALSIAAISAAVKAHSAEQPVFNRPSKSALHDSIKDNNKHDLAEIIEVIMKKGLDGTIGENLAPVIGLPGPMPMKAAAIRNVFKGDNRDALNCAVIYEESPESGKKPTCVYLMKISENSKSADAQFFRIDLDGKLEKVVNSHGAKDANGKRIRGAGVATAADMNSPAVRKTYAAEMKAVKAWLKEQKVAMAKKAPVDDVRAAAEKETATLDKEAAETH